MSAKYKVRKNINNLIDKETDAIFENAWHTAVGKFYTPPQLLTHIRRWVTASREELNQIERFTWDVTPKEVINYRRLGCVFA